MNIIPKVILIIIVSVILQYLFHIRFDYLSIPLDQENSFDFYYLITVIAFIFGIIRFNNFFNPISLVTLFMLSFAYSFIVLSYDQIPLSEKSKFIIVLSIFSVLLGASSKLNYRSIPTVFVNLSIHTRKNVIVFITVAAIIVFVVECIGWGYIPIFTMTQRNTYGDVVGGGYNFFHTFVLLLNLMPAWIYILYKENQVSKEFFNKIIYTSFFISLNFLSKQTITILLISFFLAYLFYNKATKAQYIYGFTFSLVLFLGVNYVRLMHFDKDYAKDIGEFSKNVANIDVSKDLNVYEAMFIEYSSKRFTAFEKMVRYADEKSFLGFGIYTFRPLVSILFLEKLGLLTFDDNLNSRAKVGTYVIDPYLDFGIVGVIFFSFTYGYLANRYYYQYKTKKLDAIMNYALIIQFFIMAAFINYYNTLFIWSVLLVNKLLIGGLKSRLTNTSTN
jgi:oligosaccharide repeat unit polymerase